MRLHQKILKQFYQILHTIQIIHINFRIFGWKHVRKVYHLHRCPNFRHPFRHQIVQHIRIILLLALHIFVVVVLEGMCPLQRAYRLPPRVVLVGLKTQHRRCRCKVLYFRRGRGALQYWSFFRELSAEAR